MRHSYENPQMEEAPDLKIRCPHCFQIFLTFHRELKADSHPQFQCSVCHRNFWINLRDLMTKEWGNRIHPRPVILGQVQDLSENIPPSSKNNYGSVKICPKCTHKVSVGEQECPHCGVVFIKILEGGITEGLHLRALWAQVLKFWHDETRHNTFLLACHKDNELTYGISCYGRMLKESLHRKKAQEMIKRLEALSWFFKEEDKAFPYYHWKDLLANLKKAFKSYAFDAFLLTIMFCFLIVTFS